MKKIANIFLILFSFILMQNCQDTYLPEDLAYVTFAKTDYNAGVDIGGSTTADIIVYTADIKGSDRTFNVTADGTNAATGSYTVPSSVTIPAGTNEGVLTVALTDTNLGIGISKLVISLDDTAGYSKGKPTTLSYLQNCTEVTGTLDLSFDDYGSEVYWEIDDELGGVVASTAGYPDVAGGGSDSVSITLCAGRSYTFFAADGYGDGWGPGTTYTLTIGGVVKVSGDGSILDPTGVSTDFDTN